MTRGQAMELNEVAAWSDDQDKGAWLTLVHPVTGEPVGLRLLVAGPDSATQGRARLKLAEELADAADDTGRVSADAREAARLRNLARCVLRWDVTEDGEPVPFTTANVVRLLKAGVWVQAQLDAFAVDRRNFWKVL